MYNIQKAVSRLDYAPKLKEIEVTDIKKGLGVFTPKPDKPVSFAALKETLKKAGYTLDAAHLTVAGVLAKDEKGWSIVVQPSGQHFALQGPNVDQVVAGASAGASVEITGDWKTIGTGKSAHEAISPMVKTAARQRGYRQASFGVFATVSYSQPSAEEAGDPLTNHHARPLAPIRVTSPGLTVYKGGAVTPRLYLIKQHLGDLEVTRQMMDVSVSYTPSPRLQLELEIPFARTAFDNDTSSGSGFGLGNITAWAKYRFFRTVKTYGDRQAALRVGLEMPTGKKSAPTQAQLNVPEFVRQQLTPINGGLAPHVDLAFSQAGGRFIFGGNAEVIVRAERDGFRMGHEQRVSTDLEYVLPRDDRKPGGELFLILETTFIHRGTGRVNGQAVEGSRSTEFYLSPGLQYASKPRFVIEGSYQFPVVRNTGPIVLRTDSNILLGVRYLF
ncbi:MAG: transporter [Acidobacteria bacterium]|nr:transporter [Acidobacteriota bacterium]